MDEIDELIEISRVGLMKIESDAMVVDDFVIVPKETWAQLMVIQQKTLTLVEHLLRGYSA